MTAMKLVKIRGATLISCSISTWKAVRSYPLVTAKPLQIEDQIRFGATCIAGAIHFYLNQCNHASWRDCSHCLLKTAIIPLDYNRLLNLTVWRIELHFT